jgi:membrane protein involved in colicin uptake
MRAAWEREEEERKSRLAAEVAAKREEARKKRKAKKEAQLAKLLAARERAQAEWPYDIFWESSHILAEEGGEVDQEERGM